MPLDVKPWDWEDTLSRCPAEPVETAGGVISCRVAGDGADVFLLHGIGSGSGSWAYQLASVPAGYRLHAWDAPGYGRSDPPSGAVEDVYAGRFEALLDELKVGSAVLVAHSLGAIMAARFARLHPERVQGLLLVDPARGHGHRQAEVRAAKRDERIRLYDELGAEAHAEARAHRLLSEAADEKGVALVRHNMARLRREGYAPAAELLANGDILADVARIDLPASVICGGADTITPPEDVRRIAEAFPGTRPYTEIPGAGHACYIEAADTFNSLLEDFLGGLS